MREIKFRCWDKKTHEMIYVNAFLSINDVTLKERIVMQYTGLKDKNGVEIYEGDILHNPEHFYEFTVVEWDEFHPGWRLRDKDLSRLSDMYVVYRENCGEIMCYEVIGNIYQNYELLEK